MTSTSSRIGWNLSEVIPALCLECSVWLGCQFLQIRWISPTRGIILHFSHSILLPILSRNSGIVLPITKKFGDQEPRSNAQVLASFFCSAILRLFQVKLPGQWPVCQHLHRHLNLGYIHTSSARHGTPLDLCSCRVPTAVRLCYSSNGVAPAEPDYDVICTLSIKYNPKGTTIGKYFTHLVYKVCSGADMT